MKVFNDFNTSASFELIPAVRDVSGPCIEEEDCSWETATLCAFNQTSTAGQVAFLACMDDKEGTAKSASRLCAPKANVDEGKLLTCLAGQQGVDLLSAASAAWNKAFPSRATVPHTFVGKEDVPADFNALKNALCKAGAKASVCDQKATAQCSI